MAASIGYSLFPGGFLLQNNYLRFRGAPPWLLQWLSPRPSFGGFGLSGWNSSRKHRACPGEVSLGNFASTSAWSSGRGRVPSSNRPTWWRYSAWLPSWTCFIYCFRRSGNLSLGQSKNTDEQVKTHTKCASVSEGVEEDTSPAAEPCLLTDLRLLARGMLDSKPTET